MGLSVNSYFMFEYGELRVGLIAPSAEVCAVLNHLFKQSDHSIWHTIRVQKSGINQVASYSYLVAYTRTR